MRNLIALAGVGYVLAVLLPTAIWFVPELLHLINPETDLRRSSGGGVPSAGKR